MSAHTCESCGEMKGQLGFLDLGGDVEPFEVCADCTPPKPTRVPPTVEAQCGYNESLGRARRWVK